MKIFRIYFAASLIFMIMIAAVGGIIEAENNTKRVAFGEDEALRVVTLEEILKTRID
jgi:hypothetical protein